MGFRGRKMFRWQSSAVRLVAVALFAMGVAQAASAADFEVLRLPHFENVMIMMTGEVTAGDAQRFDDTVATLGGAHATVNVSGPAAC